MLELKALPCTLERRLLDLCWIVGKTDELRGHQTPPLPKARKFIWLIICRSTWSDATRCSMGVRIALVTSSSYTV